MWPAAAWIPSSEEEIGALSEIVRRGHRRGVVLRGDAHAVAAAGQSDQLLRYAELSYAPGAHVDAAVCYASVTPAISVDARRTP